MYISLVRSLFVLFFFILFSPVDSLGQKVLLDLSAEETSPIESTYRIVEVLDHRISKAKIGEVFERGGHKIPVTFKGDLEQLATRFFNQIIQAEDSAKQEIQIRIFEVDLIEKFNAEKKLYEGEVQLGLGFFAKGTFNAVHLLDYAGSTQYQRSGFRMDKVEDIVTKLFHNGVTYFDTWIKSQALSNRALARDFRLEIVNHNSISTADKIYYDSARPLNWADFKARPNPSSKNNATIFTSFSVQGISMMDSGSVVQTLEINAYMLPRQSWIKNPSDYGLNHEQRHFDVVKIIADRLIHKLKSMELDLDYYQARINEAYLEAYREMNRLQEFYEKQTQNGLNSEEQAKWNQWIDEALAGNGERIDNLLKAK